MSAKQNKAKQCTPDIDELLARLDNPSITNDEFKDTLQEIEANCIPKELRSKCYVSNAFSFKQTKRVNVKSSNTAEWELLLAPENEHIKKLLSDNGNTKKIFVQHAGEHVKHCVIPDWRNYISHLTADISKKSEQHKSEKRVFHLYLYHFQLPAWFSLVSEMTKTTISRLRKDMRVVCCNAQLNMTEPQWRPALAKFLSHCDMLLETPLLKAAFLSVAFQTYSLVLESWDKTTDTAGTLQKRKNSII